MHPNILNSYKVYCKNLRALLRKARQLYFVNKFNSLGTDSKRNWKLLNKLMGRSSNEENTRFLINNEVSCDKNLISDSFCEHFVSHPESISQSIPPSNGNFFQQIQRNLNSMYFSETSPGEILAIVSKLKKNGGLQDVSRKFLFLCAEHVATLLSDLFNQCLRQECFPDILKTAKIRPVYKKGARTLIKNYRPIAILSNINKVFESILYERLNSFF